MIHTTDHKSGHLFDPWHFLGQKRRKLMDQSWAGLFREHILCKLPVSKLALHFSEQMGRPTKELYTALGALVIQQMQDLTDEETVMHLAFNQQWHYALDILDESDESKYMCMKTLWHLRNVVMKSNLDTLLFERSTDVLAKVFKVDTSKQRIDSVHIKSNMRRLGRIGIFVRSIHVFLVNLKRKHEEAFAGLDKDLVERYFTKKALGCFSLVKPSEAGKSLERVSADLFRLLRHFADDPQVSSMYTYRTMMRVLDEQCTIREEEGVAPEIQVKPSREIPSDSLQNPSDPDATYDGHKGQGYQVQVMETYSALEDEKEREKTLRLITHVEVQSACESDAHALIPALESATQRGLAPEEVVADSLYGSDENCKRAEEMGIEVTSPAMGSVKEGTIQLSEFHLSEKGKVMACPQGHAPVKTKHKKHRHTVAFESHHCAACPLAQGCPVKAGKKHHYLRYDDKTMRIATRRVVEHTAQFKDTYRWRAGIESTMSAYDRTTGVKRLRVRGMPAVRFCAILKAMGVNLMRASAVRKALKASPEALQGGLSALYRVVSVVKERVAFIWGRIRDVLAPFTCPPGPARQVLAF